MACAIEDHQNHEFIPIVLSNLKVYEYKLSLCPRLVSFVCDACGTNGDRSPYVSLEGDHMFFHQKCVYLPRVIQVNRHDHRVSYKYPLGLGEWKCQICSEDIDWSCGAYSCSLCPNYALHSICATKEYVWDGEELDGKPEELEYSESFKLNDDNTITHFTHEEHKMSLNKEGIALVETILCEGCVRPISSNTFYKCSMCSFILHETCANLPKTKRHFLTSRLLTLRLMSHTGAIKDCIACYQYFNKGFVYNDGYNDFDLVCSSITVPFIHGSHEHPLLYFGEDIMHSCQNCGKSVFSAKLGCIKCNYYLDLPCATLPLTVSLHNYDNHPLTLCYGEESSDKYWCDICEIEINPKKWFYVCNDCCVTLHSFCVLGDMVRYAKPGKFDYTELVLNNISLRPICYYCHHRCMCPYFFVCEGKSFCSFYCLVRHRMGEASFTESYSSPPWIEELDT